MKWLALLLSTALWAAPPLLVVSVSRAGLPPYDGSERIYRLEGSGCSTLRVGEAVLLQREGDRRRLGRLEIVSVHFDHAEAKLTTSGETFPLKGDLAIRTELFQPLPDVPAAAQPAPLPDAAALRPSTLTRTLPRSVGQGPTYREPIFFLKGDASLSPAGAAKLGTWVEAWGKQGQWSLECPQTPSTLSTVLLERITVLQSELKKQGIQQLEVKPLPPEPAGRYDAVYVVKEPW